MDDLQARLASLRDETAVFIALYDQRDRLRYANRAFRAAFALDEAETPLWADLMRRNHALGRGTVISVPDFEAWVVSAQSRRGKMPFRAFETDLVDGRWLWMTESVDRSGWMLCIANDITHLRADERTLRQDRDFALKASQTDELTGISNRRYMMAQLEAMIRSQPAGGPVSGCISILDIDFFKGINDLYGHQTGDEILLDFARRVHPVVRRHDCFGRIGGEEFMLIFPQTTLAEGEWIIDQVLETVRTARPLLSAPLFSYTCSAGIAALRPGETAKEIYSRADAALYDAKHSGRDRMAVGAR
ncbi:MULTISPECIES: GGDEF domain-containing protein [Rhizobium/Agrobacterium group]|uniref:GGDEF domain-containing protein n=1 Tax=Rhizobium/Agrobacterium group TaxID=227290 RepID=UPI000714A05B|nr:MULTISPECIES: GGDEF domain-containing protein [Rhizobium/Agrobacterium group]KQY34040.1 diguanylate cyclase [Rhizobium sp. Root483D2]